MRSWNKAKVFELTVGAGALAAACAMVVAPGRVVSLLTGNVPAQSETADAGHTAWWDNVGGCGVGGAAGGSSGGAKWVGRGITGGLVDMQLMSSITMGGDYYYKSFSARYSSKFFNKLTAGVTFPWSIKEGTFQYDTNESPNTQMVNGFGNLGLDCSYSFGETENMSIAWNLGLPTGRYDHRRSDPGLALAFNKNTVPSLVTPELQPGNGLFSTGLAFDYTMDKDWGPIMFGVSYSASFLNLEDLLKTGAQNDVWKMDKNIDDLEGWTGETTVGALDPYPIYEDYGSDSLYQVAIDAWTAAHPGQNPTDPVYYDYEYYTRTDGNDRDEELHGDFFGNSIGVNFAIGYKEEPCVHSLALNYSYKLALDWYVRRADTEAGVYSPAVDAQDLVKELWIKPVESGNRHSFSLAYGLEISNMDFPVFLAGSAAFSEDGFSNVSATVGVKGSFL